MSQCFRWINFEIPGFIRISKRITRAWLNPLPTGSPSIPATSVLIWAGIVTAFIDDCHAAKLAACRELVYAGFQHPGQNIKRGRATHLAPSRPARQTAFKHQVEVPPGAVRNHLIFSLKMEHLPLPE